MDDRISWHWRAPLLAALGAITGLLYQALVTTGTWKWTGDPARLAAGAFLLSAAISFGFVAERRRIPWAVVFSLGSGVVVGLVTWWTGGFSDGIDKEPWHLVCALLAVAIAAPLFQVARDEGGWRFRYRAVHGHAWANVMLWFASWAFVAATYLLLHMLGSLFELIGIGLLSSLLGKNWFSYTVAAAAFGGAVGLLRERDRVLIMVRHLVTAVSGVLAPVLATGLILFLLATPFKGIGLLWQATKYTTPILLSCVAAGLILANAVLGDGEEDEPRSPVLHWSAMGLAATMLPLALIAAISTGKRIHQYGLTPDRLWAVTFVAIATAYGLAYLVALIRKRRDWAVDIRHANLKLAFAVCAIALILASPLAAFGSLSAHDQMARIHDGRTPPERIDFRALAFDMGKPGRSALRSLGQSGATAQIRMAANKALAARGRWDVENIKPHADAKLLAARALIIPAGATVPQQLWDAIPDDNACHDTRNSPRCVIRLWHDQGIAALVTERCYNGECPPQATILYRYSDGSWGKEHWEKATSVSAPAKSDFARQWAGIRNGDIDIRPVAKDQLFLNGQPTGDVIEPPTATAAPATR